MKHIYLLFVLITALVSTQARATLEIIITEGIDSARPIAVLPFKYNGINPIIINKKESALLSGYGFNPHEKIKVYVFKDQLENAKAIIKKLNI